MANKMSRLEVRGRVIRYEFAYPAYGATLNGSVVQTADKASIYLNLGMGEPRPCERYTHLSWASVREQVHAALDEVPARLHPKAAFHLRGWDPLLNNQLMSIVEQLLQPAETRVVVTTPCTKGTEGMLSNLRRLAAKTGRIGLELVPLGFTDEERSAASGTREMYALSTLGGYASTWASEVKKFRPVIIVRTGVDYLLPSARDWEKFQTTFVYEHCLARVEPCGAQPKLQVLKDGPEKLLAALRRMHYIASLGDPEGLLQV